jgi:hypothetical protein
VRTLADARRVLDFAHAAAGMAVSEMPGCAVNFADGGSGLPTSSAALQTLGVDQNLNKSSANAAGPADDDPAVPVVDTERIPS